MSSVQVGGMAERTANERSQLLLPDEKLDTQTEPAIQLSPKQAQQQHESWDDDFETTTPPSSSSAAAADSFLRVPSQIERSQSAIRLHLRNLRDFADAASKLKTVLSTVVDHRRSELNCISSNGGKLDGVADQLFQEAEAIVALAENNDDGDDVAQLQDRIFDDDKSQKRRHSVVGRNILQELAILNIQTNGDDHGPAGVDREKVHGDQFAGDNEPDFDFHADWDWEADADWDEEPASSPSQRGQGSDSTSSKMNFSADALPGLIQRTENLIFELSNALLHAKKNGSQEGLQD
ncbi:hypothetical protein V1509DRAFT_620705 [Lipomyces kononenkoae]